MYRTPPQEDDRASSGSTKLLRWAALSTKGLFYEQNEDAFDVFPEAGTFVVVDGTGGRASAGPLAERAAHQFAGESLGMEPLAAATLRAWRGLQAEGPQQRGSGLALAAIRLSGNLLVHVHVGDARVYRLRDDQLLQLTRDHALWREVLESGSPLSEVENARRDHPNVITRALIVGDSDPPRIDVGYLPARVGDVLLLCSAGVTAALDDESIREACRAGAGNLEQACARLIDAAQRSGPHDNLTVMLVAITALQ